ncbi:MAG TPA: hypothetical protein VFU69_01925 [Ktedonobacterales bacterium]|nr:hypothetical protein [Ktedonobacterales bacterium]
MDTNPESREALLEALALRLTVSPFDPRTQNPQLFVGQMPDTLPFELPIPEGSRIIGGIARSPEHIDILLDVPLPPEQALAFYKERLQAAGWSEPEQPMGMAQRGGFVHSSILALSHSVTFCKGPRGPSLDVRALSEQAGFTDVRLSLNLDERESPCGQAARMRRERMHRHGFDQLIPPLVPPAGARQMGGGGGGGSDSWYSTATLEADTDLAALTAHYADQLAQGGWTRTAQGESGPCAWHTWTFQDEDKELWYGMFFMLKLPDKERDYFLYIRIELADRRSSPRPGGISGVTLSSGWIASGGPRK